MPTAPYGVPTQLTGQLVAQYIDSKPCAIRRINQGLRRGLRPGDARCTLVILDKRFAQRSSFLAATSLRFRGLLAGTAVAAEMMVRERSVRPLPRRHYGSQRMWPGCPVTARRLLDAHHKRSIAEDERYTKIADVEILSANHHRERHRLMRTAG